MQNPPRPHYASLAACFGMALLFGLSFPAQKYALNTLPPLTVTALRNLVAFAALWPLYRWGFKKTLAGFPWRLALPLTLLEPCVYYLCEAFGIHYSSASGSAILIGAIPVIVLLLQVLLGRIRARPLDLFILALSVCGVVYVVGGPAAASSSAPLLGSLLMLGASTCAAVYALAYETRSGRLDPLSLTLMQVGVGSLFFSALALGIEPAARQPASWQPGAMWAILYLALGTSVGAYFLWNYALSKRPVRQVAMFSNLVPLFGALAATLTLGEKPGLRMLAGGALVVLAACLAVWFEPVAPSVETA